MMFANYLFLYSVRSIRNKRSTVVLKQRECDNLKEKKVYARWFTKHNTFLLTQLFANYLTSDYVVRG